MNRIAAVRMAGIVEIDYAELRLYFVFVCEAQQVIVSQRTQVRIFEIIEISTISLFDKLLYVIVNHRERLAAAGRSDHYATAEYGNIYPAVKILSPITEQRRQVHRIFVRKQACFLHKGFVFVVENVVQKVVPQKPPYPYSGRKHEQITREQGCGVPRYAHAGHCMYTQKPIVEKVEEEASEACRADMRPADFLRLNAP